MKNRLGDPQPVKGKTNRSAAARMEGADREGFAYVAL